MSRARATEIALLALLAFATIVLASVQGTFAAFGASAENTGNSIAAAKDFRAPQVTAAAVVKSSGGSGGFVKQGGSYFVYANVAADTGAPASGIATVVAEAGGLTAGATAVPLVAGSYSADSGPFGYRSAPLLAAAALPEGPREVVVTATDAALNSAALGTKVSVDNTAPSAADVQTTNIGTNGLAEQGDSLKLSFSEPVEPSSVLAGWDGAAISVVVRLNDNGVLGLPLGNDSAQVYNAANTTLLPLGTVDLGRSDYLSGILGGTVRFGASGTASTMSLAGNVVTIVLGTYNSTFLVDPARSTAAAAGTASWTPTATPYDRAGNNAAAATAVESGAADKEF